MISHREQLAFGIGQDTDVITKGETVPRAASRWTIQARFRSSVLPRPDDTRMGNLHIDESRRQRTDFAEALAVLMIRKHKPQPISISLPRGREAHPIKHAFR